MMPGIHGLDVISTIHALSKNIPIIVVSGAGEIQSAITAIHNGASDYIMKPIVDLKIINRTIDKCIKQSRHRKQELLYKQHLEEELKRKSEEIERKNALLSNFNRKLIEIINSSYSRNSINRLKDFGSGILADFGNHLLASGGSVYMREENGLRLINSIEPRHAPPLIPFPLREGSAFKRVLDSGRPILVNNIDSEKNMVSSGWDGYNDSSFMIFPLPDHKGNIMGLLSLHNKTVPPFVTEDKEMGLLMSVYYKEASRTMDSIEALQLSESRYRNLTDNSAAIIYSYSIETKVFDFINNAFTEMTGFSKDDVIDHDIEAFVRCLGIEDAEDVISHFENLINGNSSGSGLDFKIKTASGAMKWVFQKTVSIFNSAGFPVTVDGIITEYSEQKEIEEELKRLISQKDLLLNEINHRVKNNMQIISSLINLQANRNVDEYSRKSLQATDDRIATLALVHDNIYDTDLSQSIEMINYIEKLISNLNESKRKPSNVDVILKIDPISIDLDRAVLCGLIINEAVGNAFAHAFTANKGGTLKLCFQICDEKYKIEISDDGTGYNPDGKKLETPRELGTEIINSLTLQLHGRIEYKSIGGNNDFYRISP